MSSTIQDTQKKNGMTTKQTRSSITARPRFVTHEQIAALAHELYVQSGHQNGRDVEFWLEAERRLREDLDA